MKYSTILLTLLPIVLAAPMPSAVDAREDMATDGEASIHIIKYNAGLVNRDTKRAGPPQVNPPVGFPSQYSADIINKRQIGKVGDKPLTGFPSRYRADLIDSKE